MSRPDLARPPYRLMERLLPTVGVYWLVLVVLIALVFIPGADDWIGPDNDDVMRLVEVRDWLGGQGWFDLMQYRLGLSGGTPMHWSRLIDAPIGLLITLFSTLLPVATAEGMAATLWPLFLCGLLLLPLGLVGRRLGGVRAMHIALGLGAIFVFTSIKFRPGALDHHNVQLVLVMGLAALLAEGKGRVRDHALAGVAAALAIAVGAETVPVVATACACVAARWIWQGRTFDAGARAFGLSLALVITIIFFATTAPRHYWVVACDSLSFGFYGLSAWGGAGLFTLTLVPARRNLVVRLAASAALGLLLAGVAWLVAPQCLASPFADLDPMLVEFWLNSVSEAQSALSEVRHSPGTAVAFYAVGLVATIICLVRAQQGKHRGFHLLFLCLLATAWIIALIQIRGAIFSNLLSIPPFALLIADLQGKVRQNPKDKRTSLAFLAAGFAAVPAAWGVFGILLLEGLESLKFDKISGTATEEVASCNREADMVALREMEPGLVAAPSNSGATILRFTHHRALSAPYHRNQLGMLSELKIGMAEPSDALALLNKAGVTILAFCPSDPQTMSIVELKKNGLYAALAQGEVPAYLQPVADHSGGFHIYRVMPD
jgi:hypothetical protein